MNDLRNKNLNPFDLQRLSAQRPAAQQLPAQRARPLGDHGWAKSTARRVNLESTLALRGRYLVRPEEQSKYKVACPFACIRNSSRPKFLPLTAKKSFRFPMGMLD